MSKEIVIGNSIESHIALLWCQMNAKEITPNEFIKKVEKLVGKKVLSKKWVWYEKERFNMLRYRIRNEMVVPDKEVRES